MLAHDVTVVLSSETRSDLLELKRLRLQDRRCQQASSAEETVELDLAAFDKQFKDSLRPGSLTSLGSEDLGLSSDSEVDIDDQAAHELFLQAAAGQRDLSTLYRD